MPRLSRHENINK
ncbi:hypothetical protein A2U01_0079044, partial [Trifolium medium]|nr:hypothetical protein [Trifolium medium]